MAEEYDIRIKRDVLGRNELLYETLDELELLWKMMTEGFYIRSPDGETWIPPKDVVILPDGGFLFKPQEAK